VLKCQALQGQVTHGAATHDGRRTPSADCVHAYTEKRDSLSPPAKPEFSPRCMEGIRGLRMPSILPPWETQWELWRESQYQTIDSKWLRIVRHAIWGWNRSRRRSRRQRTVTRPWTRMRRPPQRMQRPCRRTWTERLLRRNRARSVRGSSFHLRDHFFRYWTTCAIAVMRVLIETRWCVSEAAALASTVLAFPKSITIVSSEVPHECVARCRVRRRAV
jgi:hypothetical protein